MFWSGATTRSLPRPRAGGVGGQAAGFAAAGAEGADGEEGFAQQGVGEAGAERREQGGAGGLDRVGAAEAVGAGVAAVLVAPGGLAVEGPEGDGEDGALGQGLLAGIADDGPVRGIERHFTGAGAGALPVGEPEDAAAVGTFEGAGQQQADGGAFEQGQQGAGPGAGGVLVGGTGGGLGAGFGSTGGIQGIVAGGIGVGLGEGGEMMHLVHDEEGAVAAELGEVQGGGGGDALVGGDVSRRGRGWGPGRCRRRGRTGRGRGAWRQAGSAKASSAWRRRLSRGTTQQTRSTRPAAIRRAAASTGRRDLPPPGVTAARMSRASACPAARASTTARSWRWWERRGAVGQRGSFLGGSGSQGAEATVIPRESRVQGFVPE